MYPVLIKIPVRQKIPVRLRKNLETLCLQPALDFARNETNVLVWLLSISADIVSSHTLSGLCVWKCENWSFNDQERYISLAEDIIEVKRRHRLYRWLLKLSVVFYLFVPAAYLNSPSYLHICFYESSQSLHFVWRIHRCSRQFTVLES